MNYRALNNIKLHIPSLQKVCEEANASSRQTHIYTYKQL